MTNREIDVAIAQKIMGCSRIEYECGKHGSDEKCPECLPICLCPKMAHGWDGPEGRDMVIPPYSTDIAAAFAMEDGIADDHDGEAYAYQLEKIVKQEMVDSVGDHFSDDSLTYGIAHASPGSRCIAALASVGVEVPA